MHADASRGDGRQPRRPHATSAAAPNPGGLLGQVWIAVDRSTGRRAGDVYLLGSVDPPGADPLDVHFVAQHRRRRDLVARRCASTTIRRRRNWQWFGTLSVAPNGRIDAVWNDTRGAGSRQRSAQLYYSYSSDGGHDLVAERRP